MNPNDAAFPHQSECVIGGTVYTSEHSGLTKRELIAAMAMQALIPTYVEQVKELENAASAAVEYADALLKELERETK